MEPEPKRITFFKSFEEMNEHDAKSMARLTGVQHLQNATRLIKALYADELSKPMSKKLQFRKLY
ncbi:MAG TPA: hypothetical protein VEY71_03505 [Chitinophagales bacterium]|nr:hypothetical protein [Chitinophagales bacterium]